MGVVLRRRKILSSEFNLYLFKSNFLCSSFRCVTWQPRSLPPWADKMSTKRTSRTSSMLSVSMLTLKIVVKELSGKSIDELLAEGAEKLATMPAGGGGAAAAPAAGGAAPAEEKKEEKKEEEPEESDDDMGFGLFD